MFGITRIDPVYAAELANLTPANRRILVDGFYERSPPCSEFSSFAQYDEIWHLNAENEIQKMKKIFEEKEERVFFIFGSPYIVGYIMCLSRYNVFANK